jgi:hypothetical protein
LETVERVRVFKIKGLKCIIKLKSYKEFILEVNTAVETANILSWGKIIPVTIIGTLISVGVTVKLFFVKNNIDKQIRQENERKSALDILDKQLDDILKIAVTYPYLETKKFCETWDVKKAEEGEDIEKYQRYNVFCNLVFNYLSRLAEYCNYDLECIQKQHINMKEWVRLHQKNWQNPLNDPNENIDSYDKKFVSLINTCLGKN